MGFLNSEILPVSSTQEAIMSYFIYYGTSFYNPYHVSYLNLYSLAKYTKNTKKTSFILSTINAC